ncbi:MAG: hypothetical protein CMJ40_04625 [Phycisphaerae bacterium]|nr:hypothetical protein [Phycisphaerae bacterium]
MIPGCGQSDSGAGEASASLPANLIEGNNRGVGLMGQFDYDGAWEVFNGLVESYPDHPQLRINLAIAQLNRQGPGDEQGAMKILEEVIDEHPSNLRALYVSAILSGYMGDVETSNNRFRLVAEADPSDAYAAYYTGQGFAQSGEHAQAIEWFERSMELDPYLRSAIYGAAQATRRAGSSEEADRFLEEFQLLADNPRAHLAEIKYTKMGPKAEVKVLGDPVEVKPLNPETIWGEARELVSLTSVKASTQVGVSACDVNLDGRLDLFCNGLRVSGAVDDASVMLWNSNSGWKLDWDSPLAKVSSVQSSMWGDVDGNGWPDVFLCRNGANQLWLQTDGQWTRDDSIESVEGPALNTVDGALFDADHDGDLDIYVVNEDGPNVLLNNNRDGTWRSIGAEEGLPAIDRGSRQVLVADIDRDRDLDLIVLNTELPNDVFINDRLWRYRKAEGFDSLRSHAATAIIAADQDADGAIELITRGITGEMHHWMPADDGQWVSAPIQEAVGLGTSIEPMPELAMLDVTGTGEGTLLYPVDGGLQSGTRLLSASGLKSWVPASLQVEKGPSIVAIESSSDGGLRLVEFPPGPGRLPFIAVSFTGQDDPGQSMRSNASGIGTQYAARRGTNWSIGQVLRDDSGPGQSLQPVSIGLGQSPRLDFLAIEWSDGVYQTELGLSGSTVIEETQRQLSSCPVLFMHDGEEYVFISDLLGVGGIGFRTGRDTVVSPRPWERFLMPEIEWKTDTVDLILAEPMEESCYLDSIKLVQWALPPGWSMTLDERMGTGLPKPTGEPVFYRSSMSPSSATVVDGTGVLDDLLEVDGRAVDPGDVDTRFLGRLKSPQVLTLMFERPLQELQGQPVLVMDGWVEYPYSQTCFAAWQAGATYDPPTIEAMDADGRWMTILEKVGYPAGMPRQMSVPLDGLPDDCRGLRISTSLDLYWDSIKVAGSEPCPGARRVVLPMAGADLMYVGFPARTNSDQKYPGFDWSKRAPLWDTRYQKGFYTRYGDVSELIRHHDSALAIFGTGEAVNIRFETPESKLSPGWSSRLVLEIEGWCKDKDMFTADGDTIEPLPVEAVGEASLLHEGFNDRWMGGR